MSSVRLGRHLVERGLLHADQLASAMLYQRRTGERLGDLLLSLGLLTRVEVRRALAEIWGLPYFIVEDDSIDRRIAERFPIDLALLHQALPIRITGKGVLVISAEPPTAELHTALAKHFPGFAPDVHITTEEEVAAAIAHTFPATLTHESLEEFGFHTPDARSREMLLLLGLPLTALVRRLVKARTWTRPHFAWPVRPQIAGDEEWAPVPALAQPRSQSYDS